MIHVVPQGIEAVFQPYDEPSVKSTAARYGIEGEYLLFIGAISGRKNTARLVEAFARSAISRRKQLVLAGALAYGGEETL